MQHKIFLIDTEGSGAVGWACVQTHGGAEKKVMENLRRQDFTFLCPTFIRPTTGREVPLFPSYVFVSIDLDQPWGKINSTYGVVRILTNNNKADPKILFLPDSFISDLGLLSQEQSRIPPGTVVRIKDKDSSFYRQIGTVISMPDQKRVWLLMHLFSRDVEVIFDVTKVEALEDA